MISKIKELLDIYNIDGYIIPSTDEYQNEYLPDCNKRLEFITGFSGSYGAALILRDENIFFTDGRYITQAKKQLQNFTIYNIHDMDSSKYINNLMDKKIGYDPKLHNINWIEKTININKIEDNLVDLIWENRPSQPKSPIFIHEMEFAGVSSDEKRGLIASQIKTDALLITALDSICWILNLRGEDIEFTPFFLSKAVLYQDGTIFLDIATITAKVMGYLKENQVIFKMREISSITIDPNLSSSYYFDLYKDIEIKRAADPCQIAKAKKNAVEIKGAINCHERDGRAVAKFIKWIKKNYHGLNEYQAAQKLLDFRKEQEYFLYPSFGTISSAGANGAIIHYQPDPINSAMIINGLYLLDSGGQYHDGTTDVTRTIAIGNPSKEQIENYSRVLKGHLAIAMAKFPIGTSGNQLDALARYHLWQVGLDYDHGTGHGVGSFLSVHEGPQRISKSANNIALEPGMIISNEPGYYKPGYYGIRIENLILVEPAQEEGFLQFKTLTLVPYEEDLIDYNMLTSQEKTYIELYHKQCKNL